jgi:hypothetical protein
MRRRYDSRADLFSSTFPPTALARADVRNPLRVDVAELVADAWVARRELANLAFLPDVRGHTPGDVVGQAFLALENDEEAA